MTNLILASGSKNRIKALKLAKIPFTSIPADIDEKAIKDKDIKKRVVAIAKAKVEKVISDGIVIPHQNIFSKEVTEHSDDHFVLGADGVNIVGGKVMEKPATESEAFDMITAQSGKKCSFITGFYGINTKTKKEYSGTSETFYTFRDISENEIHSYVEREPVLLWAAAFSPSNSMAITFIESMEGSYSNFNHSLPFDQLIPILQKEEII